MIYLRFILILSLSLPPWATYLMPAKTNCKERSSISWSFIKNLRCGNTWGFSINFSSLRLIGWSFCVDAWFSCSCEKTQICSNREYVQKNSQSLMPPFNWFLDFDFKLTVAICLISFRYALGYYYFFSKNLKWKDLLSKLLWKFFSHYSCQVLTYSCLSSTFFS
jgi:hypothetical protein